MIIHHILDTTPVFQTAGEREIERGEKTNERGRESEREREGERERGVWCLVLAVVE